MHPLGLIVSHSFVCMCVGAHAHMPTHTHMLVHVYISHFAWTLLPCGNFGGTISR